MNEFVKILTKDGTIGIIQLVIDGLQVEDRRMCDCLARSIIWNRIMYSDAVRGGAIKNGLSPKDIMSITIKILGIHTYEE